MNRFNLVNYIPVIIIACFVFTIILGGVLLWPKFQTLREIQKSVREKQTELQYDEEYYSNLAEIKTSLEEYETEVAKISSAIPDYPSLPSLFSFLQKASSQSGLVLKGISPFGSSPSEKFTGLTETNFSLQVSGSYSAFKTFLASLEKSARLIEIENVSFGSPKEGSEDLFLFNLTIKVYSY
ncbi:MAG: type 4a pilus biogenesis protein PilO [Candidatus Pacebacteria bacterium]|nr:type 4a pilus biogenesis protein PilO [Candidatus Paceibacterota bacterium]